MIYFDMSEVRYGSRMAGILEDVGQSVSGLEAATGADLLVSPLDEPGMPYALTPGLKLHEMILHEHCTAGWLVQRKSGRDLINSINRLTSKILPRMRQHSEQCWLLATGEHVHNREGIAVVNGLETGVPWLALQGALLSWQLDGGYYALLANDDLIILWLELVIRRLRDWYAQGGRPDKWVSHKPTRDVLRADNEPALAVLIALPGIGMKKARACLAVWGTAATCLFWLSDVELYQADPDLYPEGVGLGTVQGIRECLGGTLTSSLEPRDPICDVLESP